MLHVFSAVPGYVPITLKRGADNFVSCCMGTETDICDITDDLRLDAELNIVWLPVILKTRNRSMHHPFSDDPCCRGAWTWKNKVNKHYVQFVLDAVTCVPPCTEILPQRNPKAFVASHLSCSCWCDIQTPLEARQSTVLRFLLRRVGHVSALIVFLSDRCPAVHNQKVAKLWLTVYSFDLFYMWFLSND